MDELKDVVAKKYEEIESQKTVTLLEMELEINQLQSHYINLLKTKDNELIYAKIDLGINMQSMM